MKVCWLCYDILVAAATIPGWEWGQWFLASICGISMGRSGWFVAKDFRLQVVSILHTLEVQLAARRWMLTDFVGISHTRPKKKIKFRMAVIMIVKIFLLISFHIFETFRSCKYCSPCWTFGSGWNALRSSFGKAGRQGNIVKMSVVKKPP